MKSDKSLYANSYPTTTTSPLEAFSTQAAMPSLKIDTLVTDVNSFKEQFFKTSVEMGCSLLLDTTD